MSGKHRIVTTPAQSDLVKDDADSAASDPSERKSTLSNHKGKLAMGVAATLGVMIFYSWREKKLAKEDPENYARLQRLKSLVRTDANTARKEKSKERTVSQSIGNKGHHEENINPDAPAIESKTDA